MTQEFATLVESSGLSESDLEALRAEIAADYVADPMMQELRLIRTLHAIAGGTVSFEDVMAEMREYSRPGSTSKPG